MNFRPERVAALIERELSTLLLKEIEVPEAVLTITRVEVSKKLERALVKVGVVPGEKAEEALLELQKKRSELQFLLLRRMNIKPMPHIAFEIDYGAENAALVEKLLLKENEQGPRRSD